MIGIGVIGCGHWGPNHIRNFSLLPGVEVRHAVDRDEARLKSVKQTHPAVNVTSSTHVVLEDADVHAVVIATPTATHHALVKDALAAGKHVLCEKPLALTIEQCRELAELARAGGRVLMVGHTFLYNAGILRLKQSIDEGTVGQVYCMHAERTNLGPVRSDVNAIFDLASHDIAIFNYLLGKLPISVSAQGGNFLRPDVEDVGHIVLRYPGNVLATILVSWIHPRKTRRITVVGDKRMVTWDDLSPLGPLMVFDKKIERDSFPKDFGEFNMLAREGEVNIPHVKLSEPLRMQAEHFVACISQGATCRSPGNQGIEVAMVLEAIHHSITLGGATCGLPGTPPRSGS